MNAGSRLFFPWEIHRLNLGAPGEVYAAILSDAELNRLREAVVVAQVIPDPDGHLRDTPTLLPLDLEESGLDWKAKLNAGMLLTVSLAVFVERVGIVPRGVRHAVARAFSVVFPFLPPVKS